jgi:hypothetical protein
MFLGALALWIDAIFIRSQDETIKIINKSNPFVGFKEIPLI